MLSKKFQGLVIILIAFFLAPLAQAHHSFAVHFVADNTIFVTGTVDSFRFSNPHGMLTFSVVDASGQVAQWRAETNSPNVLKRRGWTKESLKAGDNITVEGFPARDGTSYMRISKVVFADGHELIGQARTAPPAEKD
jgi:hypothetical protein